MNIAISLNQKYFLYTYVMLTSLFLNNSEENIDLYVLHQDLEEESLRAFGELAGKYHSKVISLKIDASVFPKECPTNEQWTLEAYFRLALTDLLPESVERLLYIDADTIVHGSLRELYYRDFQDKVILACMDQKVEDAFRLELFENLFEQGYCYFNSGVLLMNIQELRREYSLGFYLDVLKALNYQVLAPDQDLLNFVHWDRIGYLDEEKDVTECIYNLFARVAYTKGRCYDWVKENAVIIHYAGTKPWTADNVHFDTEKIWWEYAAQTPYYEELQEIFLDKMMDQKELDDYINSLLCQHAKLLEEYNQCLELMHKLVALKDRRTGEQE